MAVTITLDLPADPAHIGLVRRVGRDLLNYYGAAVEDAQDWDTLLTELCNACVSHARRPDEPCRVTLEHNPASVAVLVEGRGPGPIDPGAPDAGPAGDEWPQDADRPALADEISRRLVRRLTDRLDFTESARGGWAMRAEKRLSG